MYEAVGMIGRVAVVGGFIATAVACFAYFASLRRESLIHLGRAGFHLTTTSVFLASAALLVLIVKHQFQYHYVWAYSSRELPLGLLMSTFYAGQEGSFLLWTLMVSIIGIVLLAYTQKHNNEREVMGTYTAVLAFLMLLIVVKNPFALVEGSQIPADGKGLNPLLQNFWMQIHPPILFLGFASMAPPFALAMGALMQKKYQDWITSSLPWVVGGAMVLGLGIALGGFWAYETLGWGGWWGWDPVENSSLIPWLVSVALVHTMLTQKRTKGLIMTNFLLAILSFVTVLYSTFLTRSGVLGDASVHSFVDPGRFAFTLLVLFMFAFTDTGVAFIFLRFTKLGQALATRFSGWKRLGIVYLVAIGPSIPIFAIVGGDIVPVFEDVIANVPAVVDVFVFPLLWTAHILNAVAPFWPVALVLKLAFIIYTMTGRMHSEKEYTSFRLMSRETFLGLGSAVLGIFTLIVLLGTSLPIIPQSIIASINDMLAGIGSDATLGNTVDPSFYNAMGVPLGILIVGMAASALLLKWIQNNTGEVLRKAILPGALALVFTAVIWLAGGVNDVWMLALGCSAFFSVVVNAQVGYTIVRGNPKFTGAYVAHLGVAFTLLGVIGSGFMSRTQSIEVPQGVSKSAFGYNFTYTGYEPFWNGERFYFNVVMTDADGDVIDTVKTIMFNSMYGGQKQLMRNPGIAKFWFKDVYLEPQALFAPDPDGWQAAQFTKGMSIEFGGYKIHFVDFDMNNSAASQAFTIGGVFRVEKYGQPPQEFTVTHTTGPDGVQDTPALVSAGDLEIVIDALTPNREDLALSTVDARMRNPKVTPNPNDLRETLVVEASLKPFISLVWLGIVVMIIGFGIARARRAKDAKRLEAPSRPGLPLGSARAAAPAQEDAVPEEQQQT